MDAFSDRPERRRKLIAKSLWMLGLGRPLFFLVRETKMVKRSKEEEVNTTFSTLFCLELVAKNHFFPDHYFCT